jgi:hypothetical protein
MNPFYAVAVLERFIGAWLAEIDGRTRRLQDK